MFCTSCGKQLSDQAIMCPGCGAPTKVHDAKLSVGTGTIVAAYVLSVGFPILGLIAGIYLWAGKKQVAHGVACIIISFIFINLWGFLLLTEW
jgi:uncharacterized OB-fold protein